MKTYIVEDSPVVLSNLIAALQELTPVDVVGTATDEAAAVGWLTAADVTCELVIVDVFLQTGSGLGVLRAIQHVGFEGKRIVLTNFATRDLRAVCQSLGADRVFDKSNEIDELISYCMRLARKESGPPLAALQ